MASHKPITTEQAQRIAEEHDKSIIIILAYDPASELMHATTYGVSPRDKEWAAQGGEIAITALGASVEAATTPEDYRITQAKDLLAALKSAITIIDGTRPFLVQEMDGIRETVRVAEVFLGV